MLILHHLLGVRLATQQRVSVDARLLVSTLLQRLCGRLAHPRRCRGHSVHRHHLHQLRVSTDNPHVRQQVEAFLDELKAALDHLGRTSGVVGSLELDEHLPAREGIVQLLRMMSRDQRILLPVDEADLLMSWQLLDALADIHPRDLKPSQTFHLAGNAGEHAWEHAVKETAAGPGQKLGARFLAERGKVGVGRVGYHHIALAAHQQADCPHAPAPPCDPISLLF